MAVAVVASAVTVIVVAVVVAVTVIAVVAPAPAVVLSSSSSNNNFADLYQLVSELAIKCIISLYFIGQLTSLTCQFLPRLNHNRIIQVESCKVSCWFKHLQKYA